jgi:hypothetical protein
MKSNSVPRRKPWSKLKFKEIARRILGDDFGRRLQETQNSPSSGFLWGVKYIKQGKYISEDERRR